MLDQIVSTEPSLGLIGSDEPQSFGHELSHNGRDAAWLRLHGELSIASANQFAETVEEVLANALLVIIDLRALSLIDGVGIGMLINASARARGTGRRLVIVRGVGQVQRVSDLIELSERVHIVELKDIPTAELRPYTDFGDAEKR